MKIVQINTVCGKGSTGKICVAISQLLTERGVENYILYSLGESTYSLGIPCCNPADIKLQALKARVLGNWGFNSKSATKQMISELDRIQPDIVHLHNLHGHDCDIEMLFNYFRAKRIKLFWTFHDCWAFTGYCVHFTMAKCNKWQTGCGNCPQRKEYSWLFDCSHELLMRKKNMIHGLDLTVITPSQWLADLVKKSIFSECPVKVIHNGIDLTVFHPTPSDFRQKYHLEGKFLILGVAFGWDKRKGLDVFIGLSQRLGPEYQIILVGTNKHIDKLLPDNIISIHRTQNQQELAKIYSTADIFINPTREDNYPTVNMEAIACGTPVVTFHTGGSPESIDEGCGYVVPFDDLDALENEIRRAYSERPYRTQTCLKCAQIFDENSKYQAYIDLYQIAGENQF